MDVPEQTEKKTRKYDYYGKQATKLTYLFRSSFSLKQKLLPLEKAAVLQVVLDDDVGHCIKDKLHVLCVGGTGEVGVDLLGVLSLVQVLKLTLNVSCCLLVGVGA